MKPRHAAPVFQVADLEASLKHYTEVLGFSHDFRFGDYAGVKLGDVCLHLCGHSIHQRPVGGGTAYIFCAEPVDAYYAGLVSRGANLIAPPKDYAYGMRDFIVADPDGNHLAFGCRSEATPAKSSPDLGSVNTGPTPKNAHAIAEMSLSPFPIVARLTREELAAQIYRVAHLTGSFRLRSGTTSHEYFDKYRFESDPDLLREIATHMKELVLAKTDALAGLEMGGIPIATMLSQMTGLPARFIRKHAKPYGTCLYAEGGEVAGRRLLVIEDVVTSGGQIIESTRALRADGAIITHALCVLDREAGGTAALAAEGLELISLFTMRALKPADEPEGPAP